MKERKAGNSNNQKKTYTGDKCWLCRKKYPRQTILSGGNLYDLCSGCANWYWKIGSKNRIKFNSRI